METIKDFFTRNLALKILSFILALLVWFYIVNELNKGSQEEVQALRRFTQSKTVLQAGAVNMKKAR